MLSQLSLLNILYFAGALLVIGAMTLFMTLGMERFGGMGLFLISLLYAFIFGQTGVFLWFLYPEYRIPAGLLCSISVSMVPLGVYGLQRHFKLWIGGDPGTFQDFRIWIRSSWAPMEIATVLVSLLFVSFIRFPFLIAPAAFCLWFLSMDLVPLLFRTPFGWKNRHLVSIWFGLATILMGYLSERTFGREPDFGFWLYLFGLIPFWSGLTFYPSKPKEVNLAIYLLINLSLLLIGRIVDRTTFQVFGLMGTSFAFYHLFKRLVHFTRSVPLGGEVEITPFGQVLRALYVAILLALSLKYQSSLFEFIPAALGLIVFNVAFFTKALGSSEPLFLFHLSANLGFLFVAKDFLFWWQYVFVHFTTFLGGVVFQAGILAMKTSPHPKTTRFGYWAYRAALSIFLYFLPGYLYVDESVMMLGALGLCFLAAMIPLEICNVLYVQRGGNQGPFGVFREDKGEHSFQATLHFIFGVLLIFWSTYFGDTLSFIGGLSVGVFAMFSLHKNKELACVFAVLFLLLSSYFGSSTMATFATLNIFMYLSHLAYRVFKDSMLFPFVLTLIGIVIIYLGILFQSHQEDLQALLTMEPSSFAKLVSAHLANTHSLDAFRFLQEVRSCSFSTGTWLPLLVSPFSKWKEILLAPALLTFSVANSTSAFTLWFSFVAVVVLFSVGILDTFELLPKEDGTALCSNARLVSVQYAQGTQDHGIVRFFITHSLIFSF